VNRAHLKFCSSPEWARLVEDELPPRVLDGRELGDDLLEVGPGPGLTTDVLRRRAVLRRGLPDDAAPHPLPRARLHVAGFGRAQVVVAGDRLRFAAAS
jgi:hypothetical protein